MERKIVPAYIKAVDEQGIVEGIFSVFGVVDQGLDVLHPGSFKKTIQERGKKIRVLDQHNTGSINDAIGVPLEIRELGRTELPEELLKDYPDATGGVWAKTQFLLDTPEGKGAFTRIKAGAIDEWSFGYDAVDIGKSKRQVDGKEVTVRDIRQVKLYEYSPVLWGMNQATTTLSAKAMEDAPNYREAEDMKRTCMMCRYAKEGVCTKYEFEFDPAYTCDSFEPMMPDEEMPIEEEGKMVTPFLDLPLADRDRAWDTNAAESRIRAWAGGDEPDWKKYSQAFMWHDPEMAEAFTGYKLGYADIIDGTLTAIPKGIFAVAGALQGARGAGVDIPAGDQARVRSHAEKYYAKMREEFDDDSITVPWDKRDKGKKVINLTEQVEDIRAAFDARFNTRDRWEFWIREIYDEYVIVVHDSTPEGTRYYRVNYARAMEPEARIDFDAFPQWTEGNYIFVEKEKSWRLIHKKDLLAELEDIPPSGKMECLYCGAAITEENDSGWEGFTEDGMTQSICKECYESGAMQTEEAPAKEDDHSQSAMIALYPDSDTAKALAMPGENALSPEELHVTLAHIPDISQMQDPIGIARALHQYATNQQPLSGKINGTMRLEAGDGKDAYCAGPDIPALPKFRQGVIDILEQMACPFSNDHGFTPHITLAYLEQDEQITVDKLNVLPVSFDRLSFVIGKSIRMDFMIGDPKQREDMGMKAGRVFSNRNLRKIIQAVASLQSAITDSGFDLNELLTALEEESSTSVGKNQQPHISEAGPDTPPTQDSMTLLALIALEQEELELLTI